MVTTPDAAATSEGAHELLVSVTGLAKRFGGVTAVRDGNIDLYRGEVHALLGENGAGKSTLVNILAGIFRPDAGIIRVSGEEVTIPNPRASRAMGISVVHQHPVLFPDLTVAENIMFAETPPRNRLGLIDWKAVTRIAKGAIAGLDLDLDTRMLAKDLSSAQQQMLEIVKAMSDTTDLLVLDEPTAALSKHEVARLMSVIERLKAKGVAILFVGHRLDEVFALADRVTISRDGATVITGPVSDFTPASAVEYMVGHSVDTLFPKEEVELGETFLEVRNISNPGKYTNVNFTVRKGEIVGLAGLVGAGRTEIAQGIFGLDPIASGEIIIGGKPVTVGSPREGMRMGIAYVPEDRTREGVMLDQSVGFNMSLTIIKALSRWGIISARRDDELTASFVGRLSIKTTGASQNVSALSGGNQQKIVLSKWLATNPSILILDDPTKGVDVGAKAEVYRIVATLAKQGIAIILISNELEEVLAVSDRVITFYRGEQGDEYNNRPFDPVRVLASMTGQVTGVSK